MDKHIKTFQEVRNMQSKIASLFQDLLVERYHYKLSSENLKKNLKEVSLEVKNLKSQNEKLQRENLELKNVISECVKVYKNLNLSEANSVKEHKVIVDTLKNIFSQANLTPELSDINVTVKEESYFNENENSSSRCNVNQDDIRNEIDAIKNLHFTTQFFDNNEIGKEEELLNKIHLSTDLEKIFHRKPSIVLENLEEPFIVEKTEPFDENYDLIGSGIKETEDPLSEVTTPNKNLILNSPVFKDSGRQENSSTKENFIDDSKIKVRRENLFAKCPDFIISPLKMPDAHNSVSSKKEISPAKRARKKFKLDSPKKSPVSQLKKSNSREAEISISGVRKFTQTLLNIDCYKKKSPEKRNNGENVENKGEGKPRTANGMGALLELDEDDVIMDSPKKSEEVLEEKKTEFGANRNLVTPPATSDADLDETYVSSSIIKNCQNVGRHILEKIDKDQTPVKRPNRVRSPVRNPVPFVFKGEVVRSKAERMKLPGHACLECAKYYQNALGDVSPEKLKEILNKCSRHRDINPPSLDDTPPGYWKPYLTASVRHEDDTLPARSSNNPR